MVFAILLAILVAIVVVPVAIVAATRAVGRFDSGGMTGRLDPALDDRLFRIEEAIDAMALQIETLSQQQRALLGAPTESTRPADEGPS